MEPQELEVVDIKFLPETIDPKKEFLQGIADKVSKIEADPLKMDKDTLELVNSTKNELVKARTNIEKACKAARDPHTAYNRKVSEYERELIEIIEPEEKRLKGIEVDAKKVAIKAEREKTLPEYKERLASIGDGITETDERFLELDPNQRETYYMERKSAHLDAREAAQKEKDEAAAKEKEIAEAKIKEANLAIYNSRVQQLLSIGMAESGESFKYKDAAPLVNIAFLKDMENNKFSEFIESAKNDIIEIQAAEAVEEAARIAKEKADAVAAATKAAEDKAKQDADDEAAARQAAKDREEKEKKEAAEQAAAEKRTKEKQEAYQQWLKDSSYNESTDTLNVDRGTTILYREVSRYEHKV